MMGGMGLIMLIGLIILAAFVIVIMRSIGSFETKSKRKNDELLRNDEAYFIGNDGEIVEYSEVKAKQRI
jgi:uncharacterized membrane protein